MSLKEHGPHIDSEPSKARVSALVQIPGIPKPIPISRCMKQPKVLECEEKYVAQLEPILQAAQHHQHVLSRRELLQYITAEPSSRAEEIQQLLSLTNIEKIRATLVKLRNEAKKDRESQEKTTKKAESETASVAGIEEYDGDLLLSVANQHRAVLGASKITKLCHTELRSALSLPKPTVGKQSINVSALGNDFSRLQKLLSKPVRKSIEDEDGRLRKCLAAILRDEKKRQQAARINLYQTGLPLVPESGDCPLCEKPWPPNKLREQLEERIASSRSAAIELQEIDELAEGLHNRAKDAIPTIEKIVATLDSVELDTEAKRLRIWEDRLTVWGQCLTQPLELYLKDTHSAEEVARLLADEGFADELEDLLEVVAEKFPKATPEQVALEALTQLEVSLEALEDRRSDLEASKLAESRAVTLLDCFVKARDAVLGELYEQICGRFTELYSELHAGDEEDFGALLKPEGAGLTLEVDFFGRGAYPPHALHSEGHQDSMGLCLYLALAEHLVGDTIELTVLDDVVMSVDAEHRRAVCEILAKHFPNRQFLITTHDKTWMNQLRITGIVPRRNIWEFYNWDIDTGPHVSLEIDLWSRIDKKLDSNDVHGAAALLRRGSEQYFAYVCDLLEAPVRFSLEGRHDLGDLLPAAVGRLRKHLETATKAAKSWAKTDDVGVLEELRSTAAQIYTRTDAERWPVNPSVHFSAWENFSKRDFIPVKEAFQDLHALFVCQKEDCGAIIRVEKQKLKPTAIRCKCGNINWNLVVKK